MKYPCFIIGLIAYTCFAFGDKDNGWFWMLLFVSVFFFIGSFLHSENNIQSDGVVRLKNEKVSSFQSRLDEAMEKQAEVVKKRSEKKLNKKI